MKKQLFLSFAMLLSSLIYAQTTNIPDSVFEHYLETHSKVDGSTVAVGHADSMGNGTDADGLVTTANISSVTSLYLSDLSVADLTGLEAFSSLSDFYCSNTNITNVTTLPSVTGFAALGLDGNPNLTSVIFPDTVTQIGEFTIGNCNINSIDLNNITYINFFLASNNPLESLDFSSTQIDGMVCENAPNLTSIDMRNSADYSQVYQFSAINNPNLTCVFVDDSNSSDLDSWSIDSNASFAETQAECDGVTTTTTIPDINFEHFLETHDATGAVVTVGDTNSMGNGIDNDHLVTSSKINTVENLYINNLAIADLTGIQDFTALTHLRCDHNTLTSLDLTNNTALTYLGCDYNALTSLDLTNNTALETVLCDANQITALTITSTVLRNLDCDHNQLTSLDLSQQTQLEAVRCHNNFITALNFSNATALMFLKCEFNQLGSLDLSNSTNLYNLYCNNNQLTSLNISNSTLLENLYCQENQLTALDVANNTNLITLSAWLNQIPSIDVTQNTHLEELTLDGNPISTLDVSNNAALRMLSFGGYSNALNSMSSIDVSNNPNLTNLSFNYTQITEIDTSNNPNLEVLFIGDNQITDIDVSTNTNLNDLVCNDNQLETLNVKNGNNTNFIRFMSQNNSFLSCIQVDDATWSTSNWTSINGAMSFSENCHYNQTYVPDDNFEQALIDLGYDTGSLDDYVPTETIAILTALDVSDKDITDLTGIDDFRSLVNLNCSNNNLTTLNCTGLNDLQILYCSGNQLTNLSLLDNVNIVQIYCHDNQLTAIDNLYYFNNLNALDCSNNAITDLNVSTNTALLNLNVDHNNLTALDVSQNTLLTVLRCNNNSLTSLNVSQNTALFTLNCSSNQITDLDVSNNNGLSTLLCYTNQLTSLDFRNGNNIHITNDTSFNAQENPDLTCIFVDDVAYSESNWTYIDTASTFVANEAACDALASTDDFSLGYRILSNPVKDNLKIEIQENANYVLYSNYGTLLQKGMLHTGLNTIKITDLTAGIYFIKITNLKISATTKLIIN